MPRIRLNPVLLDPARQVRKWLYIRPDNGFISRLTPEFTKVERDRLKPNTVDQKAQTESLTRVAVSTASGDPEIGDMWVDGRSVRIRVRAGEHYCVGRDVRFPDGSEVTIYDIRDPLPDGETEAWREKIATFLMIPDPDDPESPGLPDVFGIFPDIRTEGRIKPFGGIGEYSIGGGFIEF